MKNHIVTLLVYEINKRLEQMQRRGIGCIEKSYTDGVDYRMDDTVYEITVKVKNAPRKTKQKGEKKDGGEGPEVDRADQ